MDWRGIFFVLSGVGVALLLLAVFGLRETLHEGRHTGGVARTTASHIAAIMRDPLFVAFMAAACLGGVAFFSYLSMSSFVLQGQFDLTPQMFSLVFAANAIAQLGGAQLSRLFVRRLGTARMYLTGQLTGAAAAVALVVATLLGAHTLTYIVLLALFIGSAGLGGPNGSTIALGSHGSRAGTAAAMLGMAMFSAGAIVAPTVSAVFGTSALTMAGAIAAGSLLAAIIAIWAIRVVLPRQLAAQQRAQDLAGPDRAGQADVVTQTQPRVS